MLSHEVPSLPWEYLSTDIFQFGAKDFIVIFDHFSKWLEVLELRSKTASEIISKLMFVFSHFGTPKYLISDNMPFASLEFKKFCEDFHIVQITSSPRYPQGNSIAEKAVCTAKLMLKKNGIEKLDMCLRTYRNTPIVGLDLSPLEMLIFRKVKDKLPIDVKSLYPKMYDIDGVQEKLRQVQIRSKLNYDKNTKPLPGCNPGDEIYFKIDPKEAPGLI